MKKYNISLIVLTIFMIIFGYICISKLFFSSSTDINNWRTYRNEKYGFEIKFPNNWSFYENTGDNSDIVTILDFVPTPEGEPWGDSFIGYINLYKDIKDFSIWFNQEAKFGSAGTQRMLEVANDMYGEDSIKKEDFSSSFVNVDINGFPVIVQVTEIVRCPVGDNFGCYFLGGPKGYEKEWFIFKEGLVIKIAAQTYTGPIDKFDQILSSFRFIK